MKRPVNIHRLRKANVSPRAARGGGRQLDLAYMTPFEMPSSGPGSIIQGNGADWFGPLNPMPPTAPPDVAGRLHDFPSGYNLNIRPKAYEPVTFETLRALADGYDLLRSVIETRKDQMAALDWNITPRDKKVKIAGDVADRVAKIEQFFIRPDKTNFWDTWLRQLLEDLLVLDAPAVHLRRTRGGQLYALEQVDGATIKRVIDDWARTPEYPAPAYQQVLKGYPAVDYTTRDMLYKPRNSRVHKVYGYSPVEQIIMTVNIALRRQVFQLNYFTEGTVPEALIGVPDTWTPDQIRQFQDWFDSILTGNLAERRRARFVPSAMAKTYVETKQGELFGAAEEWFAKMVCFAFSISAQPFLKMMNRATAESAHEVALEEGLAPLQKWVKALVDTIIIDEFGYTDLEFSWADAEELDPATRQKILEGYSSKGIMTINEARGELGLDPFDDDNFNKPMVVTATGYVFVSPDDQAEVQGQPNSPQPKGVQTGQTGIGPDGKPLPQVGPDGKPLKTPAAANPGSSAEDESKEADEKAQEDQAKEQKQEDRGKSEKLAKAEHRPTAPEFERAKCARAVVALKKSMKKHLAAAGVDIASQVEKALKKVGKADDDDDVESIIAGLDMSVFEDMAPDLEEDMAGVAQDSAKLAIARIGMTDGKMFDQANQGAADWAKTQAAKLVGTSSDPKFALTESTRDMLRAVISDALANGMNHSEVADAIQESYAFGEERAQLIANTEIRRSNSAGAIQGYKAARDGGVDVKKEWLLGSEACDECQENADEGPIDLDDTFPSGDDESPAHPNCNCSVSPVVNSDDTDSGDGEEEEDDDA